MADIRTVSPNGNLQLPIEEQLLMSTAQTSPAPENVVVKPTSTGPKPCCVCKDEKANRDECMLFSEKGESQCLDKIAAYKACMAGFGFKV